MTREYTNEKRRLRTAGNCSLDNPPGASSYQLVMTGRQTITLVSCAMFLASESAASADRLSSSFHSMGLPTHRSGRGAEVRVRRASRYCANAGAAVRVLNALLCTGSEGTP